MKKEWCGHRLTNILTQFLKEIKKVYRGELDTIYLTTCENMGECLVYVRIWGNWKFMLVFSSAYYFKDFLVVKNTAYSVQWYTFSQ